MFSQLRVNGAAAAAAAAAAALGEKAHPPFSLSLPLAIQTRREVGPQSFGFEITGSHKQVPLSTHSRVDEARGGQFGSSVGDGDDQ